MPTVAVVQSPPALLDLSRTMERALATTAEAASHGAELVVFPESYLPGYPTWLWRLRPGGDMKLLGTIHRRLLDNAVDIDAGGLDPLREAAREHQLTIVCGLHEIDTRFTGSTLYNTVAVIGPDGTLLNRHRKMVPTNPERTLWGRGDASGLRVVDTPVGRLASLICWENYMPLARFALYAQGVDVYVAPTWDAGERWQATLRHIAVEGGCWVVSGSTALQGCDVPEDFPERARVFPDEDEWINDGDAVVYAPFGGPVAGPLHRERGILYAAIHPTRAAGARRSLDVAGHYDRPDLFRLSVDRRPMPPIAFTDADEG